MGQLRVTQVRSVIGAKPKHRATLRALGLRRVGRSNTLPDRPEIRGMLARVPHLVRVEAVADETTDDGAGRGWGPRLGEEDGVGAPSGRKDRATT